MKHIKWSVFLPPFLLFVLVILANIINPQWINNLITGMNTFITNEFGWFLILLPTVIFLICIALFFSKFGNVRLGGEDSKPMMHTFSWFTINICTTIAAGIIFWSAAEPIQHLLYPPADLHIEAMSPEAAKFTMTTIFTHWTVLPYAIYTLPAVLFAFGYYNLKQPYTLGTTLAVLTGSHSHPRLNQAIDTVCLFTLVAGLAGSLGVGVLNLSGGLNQLFGIPSTTTLWGIIMAVMVAVFLVSAISGIMRGIRILSNVNIYIYGFILVFVFLFSNRQFILSLGVESLGEYITNFFSKSLYTGVFDDSGWAGQWPVFYFSSWMAWAPITAVFLGKIAYGRKVKELIAMNLFSTSLFSVIWFCVLSGSTIDFTMNVAGSGMVEAYREAIEHSIYQLFANMPFPSVLTAIFLIAVFLSFVTAADSTIVVISELSTKGIALENPDSPASIKVLWSLVIALITIIMMGIGNGADGLKMISNIGGPPAALYLLFVAISAVKLLVKPDIYEAFTTKQTRQ